MTMHRRLAASADDYIDRARALRPLLAASAAQGEADRRIPDAVIDAIDAADLFALLVPERWGGLAAGAETVLRVSRELGQGDGSASWVHYILTLGAWIASLMGDEGQEEVFADGCPRVCGVGGPPGRAEPVDGGFLINGRWGYATGSSHADWIFLAVMLPAAGGGPPAMGNAVARIGEVTIDDDWRVAGMCATASNSVAASNLFVPARRMMAMDANTADIVRTAVRHGGTLSDRWPLWPTNITLAVGPLLGLADAAFEAVLDGCSRRGITYTSYGRRTESHVVLNGMAEARIRIDAVAALALANVRQLDGDARLSVLDHARMRGEAGFGASELRRVVDDLGTIAGASAFADANLFQRVWRDLGVMSRHAFLANTVAQEIYGRALAGEPPIGPF